MLFVPFMLKIFMNQNIVENRQVSATMEKEISTNIFLFLQGEWPVMIDQLFYLLVFGQV